jgi:hypothetical protein
MHLSARGILETVQDAAVTAITTKKELLRFAPRHAAVIADF